MDTQRWKRVEELFAAALPLQPDARLDFLRGQCTDDPDLLRQVQTLLENDSQATDEFLRPPTSDGSADRFAKLHRPDPFVGRTIGAFTIKDQIARGGMGTVYLAEQANPRRHVALKIMTAGLWSTSAEQRFAFESQVLARLSHANIAQVYEAGMHRLETGATIHYFAMEYVRDARTITQFANEHGLTVRERLDLFLQVCDAVQHGHQKGVIHRDLKPANILVGTDPSSPPLGKGRNGGVKIIDFGVARALDTDIAATTMHTDTGQLVGTLAYMSPEQCDGDPLGIDTRSDVYSLGVVLYELLCAKLPYEVSKASIVEAARAVRESAPVRPSAMKSCGTGSQPVKGDLETIVLKALEKEKPRRYAGADALAADIRCYLRREPISARPPTPWTRTLRWAARHPVAATGILCACVAVTALVSIYASVWWLDQAPDRIEYAFDTTSTGETVKRSANLIARSRRVLHTWPTHPASGVQSVNFAQLVGRHDGWLSETLAIIGFSADAIDAEVRGQLAAFRVDSRPPTRAWLSRFEPTDLPANVRDDPRRTPDTCTPLKHLVAHIFDDVEGPELVVWTGLAEFSQGCLRIYDLRGNVLYQVWHDGGFGSMHWLPGPRLLVCTGLDERVKERLRTDTSLTEPLCFVAFAVRPTKHMVSNDYLGTRSEGRPHDSAWYRYLSIIAMRERHIGFNVLPPRAGDQPGTARLSVQVTCAQLNGGIEFVVDEQGNEIQGSRTIGDGYRSLRAAKPDRVPDPNDIQLQDFPPDASFPAPAATSRPN